MTHLTVRNVPSELAEALMEEKTRRGGSLNATVIDLLRRALGVAPDASYDNGLAAMRVTGVRRTCRNSRPTPGCSNTSTRNSGADAHLSGHLRLQPLQARDAGGRASRDPGPDGVGAGHRPGRTQGRVPPRHAPWRERGAAPAVHRGIGGCNPERRRRSGIALRRHRGRAAPSREANSHDDIWIAALAAREGATVLTTDGHFAYIGRVGSVILSPPP